MVIQQKVSLECIVKFMKLSGFSIQDISNVQQYAASENMEILFESASNPLNSIGIDRISVLAIKIKSKSKLKYFCQYYIRMAIKPQRLVEQTKTYEAFTCSNENIDRLKALFADALLPLIDSKYEQLQDISQWHIKEIHYVLDVDCEYIELLLAMISKCDRKGTGTSSVDKRGGFLKRWQDSTLSIYPIDAMDSDGKRIGSIQSTLRIKYCCKSPRFYSLCPKYGFDSKDISALTFLSESIADDLLKKAYLSVIGVGDFYKFSNDGLNRINNSKLKSANKEKLKHFMMLCGQARHILIARDQFIKGTKIKQTDIVVAGSEVTFHHRLRQFDKLGMNPMPIPKNWYTNYKYGKIPNVLRNPIPEGWKA